MRPEALEAAIRADLAHGLRPAAVLASLGTTGVGAIDPLRPIGAICRERGLYLHVDAAWAGSALLLEEHPGGLCVSAHSPQDAARVRAALEAFFEAGYAEATIEIPFALGNMIGEIHSQARVLSQSYTADGSVLLVRARAELIDGWRAKLGQRA